MTARATVIHVTRPRVLRTTAALVGCGVAALVHCSSGGAGGDSGFGTADTGTGTHGEGGAAESGARETGAQHFDATGQHETGPLCTDCDHDGYDRDVDCNDNDPLVNPDAYDFVGDGIDNDCDGKIDDPVLHCETIPASAPGSPLDFARAADLCPQISLTHTGKPFDPVVAAAFGQIQGLSLPDAGTLFTSTTKNEQINIVSSFGQNKPQLGQTLFGISNGPWGTGTPRSSPALDPAGFHLANACSDIPLLGDDCLALTGNMSAANVSVQDWGELRLNVQVPVNASGMSFDFSFFSSEFNQWWQSSANDAFFALVTSKTIKGTNIAKDSAGRAVTVNSSFFQVCPETSEAPADLQNSQALAQCVGVSGTAMVPGTLTGTGYDGAGAGGADASAANDTVQSITGQTYIYGGGTGWLTAAFPVTPGEQLELRIVIMDTFDGIKDSVVLVDGFTWQPMAPTTTGVTRPK